MAPLCTRQHHHVIGMSTSSLHIGPSASSQAHSLHRTVKQRLWFCPPGPRTPPVAKPRLLLKASSPVAAGCSNALNLELQPSYSVLLHSLQLGVRSASIQTQQPAVGDANTVCFNTVCGQLASFLHTHGHQVAPEQLQHTASTLKKLSKQLRGKQFSSSGARDVLQAVARTACTSPRMQNATLANWCIILHTLTSLNSHIPRPDMATLLDSGISWMRCKGPTVWAVEQGVRPATVSLTLWAFAVSGFTGDYRPLVAGVTYACQGNVMNRASPQELCTTVWSLVKLGVPASESRQVWDCATPVISQAIYSANCRAQDISMALYAAAIGEAAPASTLFTQAARRALMTRRQQLVHGAHPQAFSTILLAISKQKPSKATTFLRQVCTEELSARIRQQQEPGKAGVQLQTTLTATTALGALEVYHPLLFMTAMEQLLEQRGRVLSPAPHEAATAQPEPGPGPGLSSREGSEAGQGGGTAVRYRSWVKDAVTVLFAVASVLPGYAYSLALQASGSLPQHHVSNSSGSRSTSAAVDAAARLSAEDCRVLSELEAGMQLARLILGLLDVGAGASWDEQTLSNLLWIWTLLLPMEPRGSVTWVQPDVVSGIEAGGRAGSSSPDREEGGSSLPCASACTIIMHDTTAPGGEVLEQHVGECPAWMRTAGAVFRACLQLGPDQFPSKGLVQVYTAHLEAVERRLPAAWVGPELLDARSSFMQTAQQAWLDSTQDLSTLSISRTQAAVADQLAQLGLAVELEAATPSAGPYLPMRVDMLVSHTQQGRSGSVAVEVDGEFHFLEEPPGVYTSAAALRHLQLIRRVDRLVVLPVRALQHPAQQTAGTLQLLHQLMNLAGVDCDAAAAAGD